jgi:hypothetical protein
MVKLDNFPVFSTKKTGKKKFAKKIWKFQKKPFGLQINFFPHKCHHKDWNWYLGQKKFAKKLCQVAYCYSYHCGGAYREIFALLRQKNVIGVVAWFTPSSGVYSPSRSSPINPLCIGFTIGSLRLDYARRIGIQSISISILVVTSCLFMVMHMFFLLLF